MPEQPAPCPFCAILPVSKCPTHARENYRCRYCRAPLTPDGFCTECGALFDLDNPLVRCYEEQREARDYLADGGGDVRGAKQAVDDWIMEEAPISDLEAPA